MTIYDDILRSAAILERLEIHSLIPCLEPVPQKAWVIVPLTSS